MKSPCRLRLAEEADVPGILEVYAPYIRDTVISFEYEVPSREAFLERFRGITTRFPWLVCEVDGKIAGYAYGSPAFQRAAYQWDADVSVYMAPAFYGSGAARLLYAALTELLRLQGFYTLYAVVAGENERSLAFHRSVGFTEFARFPRTGYKLGRWVDLVWLLKPLADFAVPPKPTCRLRELDPSQVEAVLHAGRASVPLEGERV